MTRLLLDSHIFYWAITGRPDLSKAAVRLIETTPNVYVSTLSLMELRTKEAKGKLKLPDNLLKAIREQGFSVLDFTAKQSDNFQIFHASNPDPMDNALLAVAQSARLSFLTADTKITKLAASFPWIISA